MNTPPQPPPLAPAGDDVPAELLSSTQYEVLGELGRGGMGVVYLVRNRLMDRPEALKVLFRRRLGRPGVGERFLREIQSAARLNHPNVVTAYSALQVGDLLGFAMEYVPGTDLARLVKADGPLPVADACRYASQAAAGLRHAHARGMVHRDIKPHNMMLARDGGEDVVKILDFGLARAAADAAVDAIRDRGEAAGGTDLTHQGELLGTPEYVAPEQTLDASAADGRADIYGLGCTLYYLLAGRPPFRAASLDLLLRAHHFTEAAPLHARRPDVPAELDAVVARMIAKRPSDRYQTPDEVGRALAPFFQVGDAGVVAAWRAPVPQPGAAWVFDDGTTPGGAGVTSPGADAATGPVGELYAPQPAADDPYSLPVSPRKSATVRGQRPNRRTPPWVWVAGAALVMLGVVAALGAGGAFRAKSKDGTLILRLTPPAAEVLIDGKTVAAARTPGQPVEVRVGPGPHRVEVRKDGFQPAVSYVDLAENGREELTVSLKPSAGRPPTRRGGTDPP